MLKKESDPNVPKYDYEINDEFINGQAQIYGSEDFRTGAPSSQAFNQIVIKNEERSQSPQEIREEIKQPYIPTKPKQAIKQKKGYEELKQAYLAVGGSTGDTGSNDLETTPNEDRSPRMHQVGSYSQKPKVKKIKKSDVGGKDKNFRHGKVTKQAKAWAQPEYEHGQMKGLMPTGMIDPNANQMFGQLNEGDAMYNYEIPDDHRVQQEQVNIEQHQFGGPKAYGVKQKKKSISKQWDGASATTHLGQMNSDQWK